MYGAHHQPSTAGIYLCIMDRKDWLEPEDDHEDQDLSGLKESSIEGALIGPLLAHMQALVVQVSIIHSSIHTT